MARMIKNGRFAEINEAVSRFLPHTSLTMNEKFFIMVNKASGLKAWIISLYFIFFLPQHASDAIVSGVDNSNGVHHGFVLLSVSVYEWGRTLKQHISAAGFVGCVPTDAPTRKKTG
ncbi:MAG: hypothetical protein IJJ42_03460 [Clostridia bacterium]|nr:hypothetical protein [Clostridia bacterium]